MKKYLVYVLIISLVVFYSCKKEIRQMVDCDPRMVGIE
jgi:hypothetical protein